MSTQETASEAKPASRSIVAFGIVPLSAMLILAVIGSSLLTVDPNRQVLADAFAPPSGDYLLGADNLGRSVAARVVAAARISLGLAVFAVVASMVTGIVFGFLTAYRGGWVEYLIMRMVDVVIACPTLLFVILVSGLLGGGYGPVLFGLWMSQWPAFTRLASAVTRRELISDHVESARLLGFSTGHIFWRHVLPGIGPYLYSLTALAVGGNVLTISSVGFLGIGLRPPDAEWGAMIADGMTFVREAPHMVLAPAVAVLICTFAATILGEHLGARQQKPGR
jgi:peptide/nickel transport system permease protein